MVLRRYGRMTRQALRLRPVTSNKEVLDSVSLGVTGGTTTGVTLATGVQNYTGTQFECPVGARINGFYLFIQIGPDFTDANVDWYLAKRRSGQSFATDFPTPGATGGSNVRNQIYHEEKGIPGDNGSVSPLTFRGFIAIPKRYQRMREGDVIQLRLRSSDNHNLCVKAIYKWFI